MPTRSAFSRLTAAMTALCCTVTALTTACDGDPARSPVQDIVARGPVPGAAELSQDAHGVSRFTTAGVADLRTGRRIGRMDRFRAGSITKTVVATVVLQLAAEGRLRLDEPVAGLLPRQAAAWLWRTERPMESGRNVTIRQLLTHTSGLYSYTDDAALLRSSFGTGFAGHRFETHPPEALVRTALGHRPYAPPGTRYHYSNTDYVLLGMAIRQVTGRPYADEVRRRVIRRLGLTGTSLPGTRVTLPEPHGRAYSPTPRGGPADVTDLNPSVAGAAGELVSTLPDLNRFFAALLSGELLPAGALRLMRDTGASRGRYGMGLFPVRLPCGVTLWGHNGEINGSYAGTMGTADGRHVLTYRANSDAGVDAAAEERLLRAEFC
ncbi:MULTISPECIES: serine hydrolase domain-containing protein [Streptomyces]|uniref:serine hydrolase domain-containing protein n=1 Tax=Streptomyces TaxID=1883 RepID=UPI00163BF942|nr:MULTISPECIES: serine hydrolase domain-containing protein [Streptomyces]MBC2875958.1 beta-lactamase family protein [Streptomyces sp. TYQ1024]UBI38327.1 beta-lactamase family protein [Streptomyces mobaraensis]UKW30912.1 beta-lactamase family protein [Streptomyces sp. TYQ1024]